MADSSINKAENATKAGEEEPSIDCAVKTVPQDHPVKTKSIFDDVNTGSNALEVVRLDGNQTALIPFTHTGVEVDLHFLDTQELWGYTRCNGRPCVLCDIGRKTDKRLLLPVFVPTPPSIAVLPIPPAMTVGALKPQLLPLLNGGPSVLLITKPDRVKYDVQSVPLREGMNDGGAQIKAFTERFDQGQIDLTEVYQQLDNDTLAQIPFVKEMMAVKGVSLK